jgi:putative ABC transport system permease protein
MLALIGANLARRKARASLTAGGIAVGVAAIVAAIVALLALSTGLDRTAGQLVHLGRADLGLFQRGAADPSSSVLSLSLLPRLEAQPEILEVAPIQLIVEGVARAPGAIVLGIEPHGFVARLLVLTAGRSATPTSEHLVVGDVLAGELHLRPGATLPIGGHRFEVAGIFHSGITEEDAGVIMDLGDAQALAGRTADEVTTFAVRLRPQTSTARAERELSRAFPGLLVISDPSEAVRAGANGQLISKAVLLIVVLALIIGALTVANTMLAAVLERRRELALLSTIGWSARQLGGLVLGEAITVSMLGTSGGVLLGVAAGKLLPGALGLGAFISPVLTLWTLARAVMIGIAIGVVGAVYPIWLVTRMRSPVALART